jgi:hypothetical protein
MQQRGGTQERPLTSCACAISASPRPFADTIPKTADALRGRAPFEILSIVSVLNDILGIGIA